MNNQVRIDFYINWELNKQKLQADPLAKGLRNVGKLIPVRVFLEPSGEMLAERMIDINDHYRLHETYFIDVGFGRWTVRFEDLSGWLTVTADGMRLNGVELFSNEFVLG